MSVVKILRSTTPGAVPAALQSGQIAINEADGIIFWLDAASQKIASFSFKAPTGTTQPAGDSSANLATTAFVAAAIASIANGAPAALGTLAALAAAIGGDANFATTINNALSNRLRFDAVQALTARQQAQGQANLGLGTAATQTVGTAAGDMVALDANAKLPAVDGSQLKNLPTTTSLPWTSITSRPTNVSAFANDAGYITASALSWGNISGRPSNVSSFANDAGYVHNLAVQPFGDNANGAWNGDPENSPGVPRGLAMSGGTLIQYWNTNCNCNCNC